MQHRSSLQLTNRPFDQRPIVGRFRPNLTLCAAQLCRGNSTSAPVVKGPIGYQVENRDFTQAVGERTLVARNVKSRAACLGVVAVTEGIT